MNSFKKMDELVFEFGKDIKYYANNFAGETPGEIKTQLYEYMFARFCKEIEAISEVEAVDIKYKKKFYNKLFKAKRKLTNLDRADAWFDKIFQKYFNRGILEHLIVYAINFLHRKHLFVSKRLFAQIDNDDLLAEFTVAACDYLGWTSQRESVEEPTSDEMEVVDEEEETEDLSINDEDEADDEQCTDVTVYEPKLVQPIEQPQQPVAKVERTVTHEVMTVTPGGTVPVEEDDDEEDIDVDGDEAASLKSEEKVTHRFHRPGGKSGNKSQKN